MAVLTGVLHLDGLADTADALVAPYPAAAERARKDPAVGPGGVAALVLVLATEVAALAGLASSGGGWLAGAALVVGATVARTMPVLAVQLAPVASRPTGSPAGSRARVGPVDGVVALVLAASLTAIVALAVGSVAVALGGAVGAVAGLAHRGGDRLAARAARRRRSRGDRRADAGGGADRRGARCVTGTARG